MAVCMNDALVKISTYFEQKVVTSLLHQSKNMVNGPQRGKTCLQGLQTTKQSDQRLCYSLIVKYHI